MMTQNLKLMDSKEFNAEKFINELEDTIDWMDNQ